jgi:hypothetical protein
MSTLPLNEAPSAMRIRGARMSPTTVQFGRSSARSLAEMSPWTVPLTVMDGRLDGGLDEAAVLDDEGVAHVDATLDGAVHDELLLAGDLAVDDDAAADDGGGHGASCRRSFSGAAGG